MAVAHRVFIFLMFLAVSVCKVHSASNYIHVESTGLRIGISTVYGITLDILDDLSIQLGLDLDPSIVRPGAPISLGVGPITFLDAISKVGSGYRVVSEIRSHNSDNTASPFYDWLLEKI